MWCSQFETSALKWPGFVDIRGFLQNPAVLKGDLKSVVLCEKSCPLGTTCASHTSADKTVVYSSRVSLHRSPHTCCQKLDAESTREVLSDVIPLQAPWTVSHCNTHENRVVQGAFEFCSSELSWQRVSIFKIFPSSV